MSEIQTILVKDGGEEYEFYFEPGALVNVGAHDVLRGRVDTGSEGRGNDEGDYRDVNLPTINMKDVHRTIRGYARYAIGAFINFGLAEIEEMNLEFNLKIAGKAGMPILAESSAEGTFKVQVKCKFPD